MVLVNLAVFSVFFGVARVSPQAFDLVVLVNLAVFSVFFGVARVSPQAFDLVVLVNLAVCGGASVEPQRFSTSVAAWGQNCIRASL